MSTTDELPAELLPKRQRLLAILGELEHVAVAFSGGVDSAVVTQAAALACGERAIALTADSPSVPRAELHAATQLARQIGIRHVILPTRELDDPRYRQNRGDRCYYCKTELYGVIRDYLARTFPATAWTIVSGANRDDRGDYRPGLLAAAEHGVRHPLQEADLGKAEVRQLARAWSLPVWDKPAAPCLSSRLAPGVTVTSERLAAIEAAEAWLHARGLRDCRVRLHDGGLARVEVPLDALPRLAEPAFRTALVERFRQIGFRYVTLDLEGLRSGNLNDLVDLELRRAVADRLAATPSASPAAGGQSP